MSTLPTPFSTAPLSEHPFGVVSSYIVSTRSWLPGGWSQPHHRTPSLTRIQTTQRKSTLSCPPCITSTPNCFLMDVANTTSCVCQGPSDLSDPWVKGTITHLYVQLPVTGLHDKAQRHFDEVNNLAPSIITCCSQILMPFQGLLRQTNEIMNPFSMTPGNCKLDAEAQL